MGSPCLFRLPSLHISIHAPRVGSDSRSGFAHRSSPISIHAPRVGSDSSRSTHNRLYPHFNPRSPCGERLQSRAVGVQRSLFQSTLPVWGATFSLLLYFCSFIFQSTLPVWGATSYSGNYERALQFQSTLPVWGATATRPAGNGIGGRISIHAPRVGSDLEKPTTSDLRKDFNPRSPCGERRLLSPH